MKKIIALLAVLAIIVPATAQANISMGESSRVGCVRYDYQFNGIKASDLNAHPRLIMRSGDEQVIKAQLSDPKKDYLLVLHDLIMDVAAETLSMPCQERTDTDGHILARVRNVEKRVLCLSYAYRMTGDRKWADRAVEEMVNACNYRDWDPAHYLDTAEMIIALSIGYDWLFELLSPEVRHLIEDSVLVKGLRTAEGQAFYTARHNWNQVCNAAMIIGSLAFHEAAPEETDGYIRHSLESNVLGMSVYAPDGMYPEGNTYWGYGTSYQILLIEALRTALGCDFGIPEEEGFLATGNYIKYLATPTGRCFSFYDSNTWQIAHLMTFWFATETGNPSLCHLEKNMLREGRVKECDRWWPCVMPTVARAAEEADDFEPDHIFYARGLNPVWIYRSGWDDQKDTYLGVKGGNPCNNHGHMDNGSFYFERNGVLWAADLGSQSYGTFYKYGVSLSDRSQNGQRWSIFRIGPTGHNVLIMNGQNALPDGKAGLYAFRDDESGKGCSIDLSQTYSPYASYTSRTVRLSENDGCLTVCDTVIADKGRIDLVWNMLTFAEPEIDGQGTIVLTKGNYKMRLSVECDVPCEPFIKPAGTDKPWDAKNDGASRVGFALTVPEYVTLGLRVTLRDEV